MSDMKFKEKISMTKEQFYNYKFSIKTQVIYKGEWHSILWVDFEHRDIMLKDGMLIRYYEIEDIKDEV